jgi:DNA helicase II / ATP-dependent DNA helicase PcrA
LPFAKQVSKFIEHVLNYFKSQLESKIVDLKGQYDFITESYFRDAGLSDPTKNSLIRQMKDIFDYKRSKLEKTFNETFTKWKEQMVIPDPLTLYKQILSFEVLNAFSHEIGEELPKLFSHHSIKKITYFDLPPMLYIYLSLYEAPVNYAHMIIDEAQDFSYMHFLVLSKLTKTMTVLGDKDQSIFLNYGQENWDRVQKLIFNDKEDMLLTMNNSYRSTKEIIEVANNVLSNQFGLLHTPIRPINRSGPKVGFDVVHNGEELFTKIKATINEWKSKYKRIAIIHKDERKAKKLADYLQSEIGKGVVYINPEEDVKSGQVSVLASYNSKGMEFDGVILVNVNEESFPTDDLHSRLLYVLLTRAQQEVRGFYQDTPTTLLEGNIKPLVKAASRFDDIL